MDYAVKDKLRVAADRLCDRLSVLAAGSPLIEVVRHALSGAIASSDEQPEVIEALALISSWLHAECFKVAPGTDGDRDLLANGVVSAFNAVLVGMRDA
ncbi:MAG: hypothetical protein FJX72_19740 [Armatimonadetes bacterium]|nr:hypothetical protein [Armatimonadota bacterium]